MQFGVVVFPGSNCDRDMYDTLGRELGFQVRMLWHKDRGLGGFNTGDCVVLPGGFSFGDYLRCGAIARFSPLMQSVVEFARAGGKVLGVCNGFQILCEAGLLPGVLLANAGKQFVCKNIYMKGADGKPLCVPVAHGEGRYYADEATLDALEAGGQVLYRYCDEAGRVTPASNPNGALRNIAGICNASRNVFGMMPHPERASCEALGNTDGKEVFRHLFVREALALA